MGKFNKLVWKLPEPIHTIILKITGYRLIQVKEITGFKNNSVSLGLDGKFHLEGRITDYHYTFEWSKTYPINKNNE